MPEPNTGCWLWMAGLGIGGYGKFWANNRTMKAHRFSYEIYNGKIENGLLVCHSCDNPICVNPQHLFLGTNLDNATDKILKGRSGTISGSKLPQSKINEKIADEIRTMAGNGFSQSIISKKFDIAQPTISDVINNRTWKKV